MTASAKTRLILWLSLFVVGILIVSNALVSRRSFDDFERVVLPGFLREATTVGSSLADQIDRAIELGVPVDRLVGMDEFLQPALESHKSFVFIAMADSGGKVLYAAGLPGSRIQEILKTGQTDKQGRLNSRVVDDALGELINTAVPITAGGATLAWLHVGIHQKALDTLWSDTAWDVVIVLLVSLIMTIELLVFIIDRLVTTPLRGVEQTTLRVADGDWSVRAVSLIGDEAGAYLGAVNAVVGRVNDHWRRLMWKAEQIGKMNPDRKPLIRRLIGHLERHYRFRDGDGNLLSPSMSPIVVRAPLFVGIFAEGLSASFLPLYAKSLYAPLWGIAPAFMVGLPITVFMLGIVLATPSGGAMVRRYGPRSVFLVGSLPYALGYLISAFAGSIPELLVGRFIAGLGYAFVTIAAQGYLAQISRTDNRTRNMAVFVAAVWGGMACGGAVGAVIADRIGFASTFLVAFFLISMSAFLVWRYMEAMPGEVQTAASKTKPSDVLSAFANPRYAALVVLATIPAKIFLTGLIFYLAPLLLNSLDMSQPAIGRTVMSYAFMVILTSDLSAWFTDRYRLGNKQIIAAGLLTGAGTLPVLFLDPATGLLIAIATYGLSQGFSAAPVLSIVPEICPEETRKLGAATLFGYLRLSERIGSVAGPFIAAFLVSSVGYIDTVLWIGAISAGGAVLYAVVGLAAGLKPNTDEAVSGP